MYFIGIDIKQSLQKCKTLVQFCTPPCRYWVRRWESTLTTSSTSSQNSTTNTPFILSPPQDTPDTLSTQLILSLISESPSALSLLESIWNDKSFHHYLHHNCMSVTEIPLLIWTLKYSPTSNHSNIRKWPITPTLSLHHCPLTFRLSTWSQKSTHQWHPCPRFCSSPLPMSSHQGSTSLLNVLLPWIQINTDSCTQKRSVSSTTSSASSKINLPGTNQRRASSVRTTSHQWRSQSSATNPGSSRTSPSPKASSISVRTTFEHWGKAQI